MSNENKKNSKFHIVTEDEIDLFNSLGDDTNSEVKTKEGKKEKKRKTEIEEKIEEVSDSSVEKEDEIVEDNDEELPDTVTKEEYIDNQENNTSVVDNESSLKKPYFSFETRVIMMVVGIIILILISCFMINKALKYTEGETVTYNEVSQASYQVCLKGDTTSNPSCLVEGMQYTASLVNTISAFFQYDVKLSSNIYYDLSYHIVGLTKIYDQNDNSKVLYQKEDVLLDKTPITENNNRIRFNTTTNIDYNEYTKFVQDYMNRYSLKSSGSLEIILYLDEPEETRKISSITIPIGPDTFSIGKYNLSNTNQVVKVPVTQWNEQTTFYGIIATILLLISMILIFKTAKMVLKVTNNRNRYQSTLSQILRDYDRIIVVARGGYESNIPKKEIKVKSFDELLDARDVLEKPIIYSKVNPVKSEFIVEDDEKLYKYVMKESDFN